MSAPSRERVQSAIAEVKARHVARQANRNKGAGESSQTSSVVSSPRHQQPSSPSKLGPSFTHSQLEQALSSVKEVPEGVSQPRSPLAPKEQTLLSSSPATTAPERVVVSAAVLPPPLPPAVHHYTRPSANMQVEILVETDSARELVALVQPSSDEDDYSSDDGDEVDGQADPSTLAHMGLYIDTLQQVKKDTATTAAVAVEQVAVQPGSSDLENAGPSQPEFQVLEPEVDPQALAGAGEYMDAVPTASQPAGMLQVKSMTSDDALDGAGWQPETLAKVGSYIDRLAKLQQNTGMPNDGSDNDDGSCTSDLMVQYLDQLSGDGYASPAEEQAIRNMRSYLDQTSDGQTVMTQDLDPETLHTIRAYIDNLAQQSASDINEAGAQENTLPDERVAVSTTRDASVDASVDEPQTEQDTVAEKESVSEHEQPYSPRSAEIISQSVQQEEAVVANGLPFSFLLSQPKEPTPDTPKADPPSSFERMTESVKKDPPLEAVPRQGTDETVDEQSTSSPCVMALSPASKSKDPATSDALKICTSGELAEKSPKVTDFEYAGPVLQDPAGVNERHRRTSTLEDTPVIEIMTDSTMDTVPQITASLSAVSHASGGAAALSRSPKLASEVPVGTSDIQNISDQFGSPVGKIEEVPAPASAEEKKEQEDIEAKTENPNESIEMDYINGLLIDPSGKAELLRVDELSSGFRSSEALLRLYSGLAMSEDPTSEEMEKFQQIVRYSFPFFDGKTPTAVDRAYIRQEARRIELSLQIVDRFIAAAIEQPIELPPTIEPSQSEELLNAKLKWNKFELERIEEVTNDDDALVAFIARLANGPDEASERKVVVPPVTPKEAFEIDFKNGVVDSKDKGAPSLASDDGPWWEAAARLAAFSSEQREARINGNPVSFEEDFIYSCETDNEEAEGSGTEDAPNDLPRKINSVDDDIDIFWKDRSTQIKGRRLQNRSRGYVTSPPGLGLSFSGSVRASRSFEAVETKWVRKRSMAMWTKSKQWLPTKNHQEVVEVSDPKPIDGVAVAATLDRPAFRRYVPRDLPGTHQWRLPYKDRTQAHPGYFDVNVYSLYETTDVVAAPAHRHDEKPWEHRDVKQRFLYEQSIGFSRNWFGRFREMEGIRIRQPVSRPKSMEMPMKVDEWSEEWYSKPWAAPLESNLSGSVSSTNKKSRRLGPYREPDEDDSYDSWEETPECGTIKNVRLKIGERISRVTPDLTSSLRRSRWRKKHFPKGTFPY